MSNEMNYSIILNKFNELHNKINVIKIKIINKINFS